MPTRRDFLQFSAALPLLVQASALAQGSVDANRLAHDSLRPQYHLLPPGNWMNDPNGPIFWNGKYHLFYQLNPHGAAWGDISWGHAVSPDMVHWRHLPPALEPTPDSPDSFGVFSGSALEHDSTCYAFYTATRKAEGPSVTTHGDPDIAESQCLATARDPSLRRWTKRTEPLIAAPPPGMEVLGFRDPSAWRLGDAWYMTVGCGTKKAGGMVLLYRSHDLQTWEYLHPLAAGAASASTDTDAVGSGNMWECPDFFPLGDRHVLLYSTAGQSLWTVGHLDPATMRYEPEQHGVLDTGAYYAPKSMPAPDGRRILWGWIPERRPQAAYVRAGWAGVMSLPRVLTLAPDGSLAMSVAHEVNVLAGTPMHCGPKGNASVTVPTLAARVQLRLDAGGVCSVHAGGEPLLTLMRSVTGGEIHANDAVLSGKPDDPITLYVDGSVLEIFQGTATAHTVRAYPQLGSDAPLTVSVTGTGTDATVTPMHAISRDRLTT